MRMLLVLAWSHIQLQVNSDNTRSSTQIRVSGGLVAVKLQSWTEWMAEQAGRGQHQRNALLLQPLSAAAIASSSLVLLLVAEALPSLSSSSSLL